jgi:hypothetical protein
VRHPGICINRRGSRAKKRLAFGSKSRMCVHVREVKIDRRTSLRPDRRSCRRGAWIVRAPMTTPRVTSMSIKLTDTQIVMLSAAAQRNDRCLLAPQILKVKGSATRKLATKLIGAGLAKEIKAKPGAPVRRRDEQADQPYALKLTAAGAKTFAIDDGSASNETREDISQHLEGAAPSSEIVQRAVPDVAAAEPPSPSAPRGGTKTGASRRIASAGSWRNT